MNGKLVRAAAALVSILFILSGCGGLTISHLPIDIVKPDSPVAPSHGPLVDSALGRVDVSSVLNFAMLPVPVEVSPAVLQRAIESAIGSANIFGLDFANPARIQAQVVSAEIRVGLFAGAYPSKLSVKYTVSDARGRSLFDETIVSEGADDTGAFLGETRRQRSLSVVIANNVMALRQRLRVALAQGIVAGRLAGRSDPGTQGRSEPTPRVSAPATVSPEPGQSSAGPGDFGRYHALVIGNQAYRHLPALKTPAADAQAVAELLRRDYRFTEVVLLTNATRTEIVRALDEFRGRLIEKDNLLIYYAGHGYLDKDVDRGYWLPVDAESESTANWLSNVDITDKLRGLRAKHVLVVADSCYSGTLVRDVAVRPLTAPDLTRLAQKRARTAITSGGLEPVLDVGGGSHSVFARAFMETLRNAGEVIDATSLFGVIRRQVLLHAEQTPQYSDIRQAGHDGGDFLFVRPR